MATNNSRDVKMRLSVETLGEENIRKLAGELDALSAESKSTSASFDVAGVAAGRLEETLAELVSTTKAQRDAEASAQTEIKTTRTALDDQRDALARLRIEYATAGGNADKFKSDVLQLRTAILDSKSALRQKQDALASAAAGARAAGAAEQELTVQIKNAADAARQAGEKISDAFSTLGVRSADDMRNEILHIREAMEAVSESAGSTGEEIDSAFEAGNERIADIELELRRMNGTLTLSDRLAAMFSNSIGQFAAGNLIADGVGYLVNKVKELGIAFVATIADAQQMTRALNAIYKDTQVAGQQFHFLRDTAMAAGVSVSDMADSFTRFSAATHASNISLQVSNEMFESVTRAAGTLGLSGDQASGTLDALAQMASKGVVSMEELRQQLGDRLPGALSLAEKGLGLADGQLINLVESGSLATRDFFPAFARALKDMHGEVSGLTASYNQLKNALSVTAEGAGDSGWATILSGALAILTAAIGAVVMPLQWFSEYMLLAGKAAVSLFGALRGDVGALDFFSEEVDKANKRMGATAVAFGLASGILERKTDTTKKATTAEEAHNQALAKTGTDAAQASLSISTTAKAQQAQAYAAKLAADNTLDHSSRLVQLTAYIDGLLGAQAKEIDASGKLADAAKIEGDSLVKLTELQGQQALTLDAQVSAALKNVAALDQVATAHRTETELLTQKRDAFIQTALKQDEDVKQRQAVIDAIEKKIKVSAAETETSKATADAMRNEVEMRRLNVQAYKDNSARVGEFQKAVDAAQKTLDAMVIAEEAGKKSAADLAEAQGDVAKATYLLNDALKDTIANLDREARMKQASANLTIAKMNAELDNIKAMAEAARAMGNYELAAVLEIDARRKQIEIIEFSILAKEAEAKATIKGLEIERAALDMKDPMLKAKQDEIDIRLANAKAKLVEAGAGKDVIAALEREIQKIRENGVERKKNTGGQDDNTGSRHRNTGAIDAQTSALEQQNATQERANAAVEKAIALENKRQGLDKQGFSTNTNGDRVVMQGANTNPVKNSLTGQWHNLDENGKWQNLGPDMPVQKDGKWVAGGRGAAAGLAGAQDAGSGGFATPTAQSTSASKTVTVNINVPGRQSRAVNVVSQNDANTLTSMLRDLESAAGVSS